jgi:hypothetical protein
MRKVAERTWCYAAQIRQSAENEGRSQEHAAQRAGRGATQGEICIIKDLKEDLDGATWEQSMAPLAAVRAQRCGR